MTVCIFLYKLSVRKELNIHRLILSYSILESFDNYDWKPLNPGYDFLAMIDEELYKKKKINEDVLQTRKFLLI